MPGAVSQDLTMAKAADLYGLPLDEFTRARDELARELRRSGKKCASVHMISEATAPPSWVWSSARPSRLAVRRVYVARV